MKRKINLKLKKKYLIIFGSLIVLALGLFLFQPNFSGNVILNLDAEYREGENLDGVLKLSLSNGEFIPASSIVIFETPTERREFALEDIISEEPTEGEYYIEERNLSGQGVGYGLIGVKEIYPELSFVFNVYFESKEIEEEVPKISEEIGSPIIDDIADMEIIEDVSETNVDEIISEQELKIIEVVEEVKEKKVKEEKTKEESNIVEKVSSAISMSFASLLGLAPVTGQVALNLETSIPGKVSLDNPFSYNLEDGQTAELLSGSVMDGSTMVDDGSIMFEVVDGKVSVSSDYFETKEGFGEDYLGNEFQVFEINLSALDLNFDKGTLEISFIYNDEQIVSLSTVLQEGKVDAINETDLIEVPEFSSESLTESEKQILIQRFGDVSIKTTKSEVIDGRLFRNYKVGNYELIASYDYDMGITDSLKEQMERDKINFLRDLIRMISKDKIVSKNVDEFLVNSNF